MIKVLPSPELSLNSAFLTTLNNVQPLQPGDKYVRVLARTKGESLELNDMCRENVVVVMVNSDKLFDVAHWNTSDGVSYHTQESYTFDRDGIAKAALKVYDIFNKDR